MEKFNTIVNEEVFKSKNYTWHCNYIAPEYNPKRTQRPFAKGDLSVNMKLNMGSF